MALGGLGDWVADAVQGDADAGPGDFEPNVIPLRFSVPW
jgi:hypothetical protein